MCCSIATRAAQTPFNPHAVEQQPQPDTQSATLRQKALVNALLYRSKQRGFLEMDLLVGLWAEQHLPRLDGGPAARVCSCP